MKGRAEPQTSWSDSDVAILTQGKLEGKSASQIAADLQAAGRDFSRNAVIGRLHRMFKKLPGDHELVRAERAAVVKKRLSRAAIKVAPPKKKRRAREKTLTIIPSPAQEADRLAGLYFDDEWPRSACRYPLFAGAVDLAGPIFCGEPVAKRSFCADHYALCWTKPQRPVSLKIDRPAPASRGREFIFGRRYA